MNLTLTRRTHVGKSVPGTITLPFEGREPLVHPTLENADFLIPAGTYPLRVTWSPRFKKDLPLIDEVPDREGIRIHLGTKPEHSEGCVLVDNLALGNILILYNYWKKYLSEDEPLTITVSDPI